MNEFVATLGRLFGQVIFWAMVAPWEQAIRVRAGKHVRRLAPGFHLRIPILDVVMKQTVCSRSAMIPTQTLSTADGHTLIVGATLGYAIADIEKLYRTLHHAEDTVVQIAASAVASYVALTPRDQLTGEDLSEFISVLLAGSLADAGLAGVRLRLTDFAYVRAFRLVQDQRWNHGRALDVTGEPRS